MFKILVNGVEHSRYTDTCGCVNVGSAADAKVCLSWAAPFSLQIRPLTDGSEGDFSVTVHDPAGITHHTSEWWGKKKTVQWKPNPPVWLVGTDINSFDLEGKNPVTFFGDKPPGWFRLRGGDAGESMIVRGHVIEVITWCATCGRGPKQLWSCTCADHST